MRLGIAALMILLAGPAVAQQHQHQHGPSPYTGLQQRGVKALSDEQISDLRAGKGMGLALAAERNGYPGPMHVLALADELELSGLQRAQIQQLYDAMKADAIPVGEKLIAHETALVSNLLSGLYHPPRWHRLPQTSARLRENFALFTSSIT